MITTNAENKIAEFKNIGLHYNLVANEVYKARASLGDPFDKKYLPYIVAGLISFDMNRMMGKGAKGKYDIGLNGFARRLYDKLQFAKGRIENLVFERLAEVDIGTITDDIIAVYHELARGGSESLHQGGKEFHVGATKILHFINPELFIIVDSNASRAFKSFHDVAFRNTTKPGYSSDRYLQCMSHAKQEIIEYGISDFCALEPGTPLTRIYDKLTFVTGSDLS